MSEKTVITDNVNLLQRMGRLDIAPQLDGYTGVELLINDEESVFVGDRTGRVMTAECPWGTRRVAERILARLRGYQYQPMEAQNALMNPAAELMDGMTADGIYGGIYKQQITFGPQFVADVSAPVDEEINHEYPWEPQRDRKIRRRFGEVAAEFRITNDRISAEVKNLENADQELSAGIAVEAGRITAEARARAAGDQELSASIAVEAGRITAEAQNRASGDQALSSRLDIQAGQISAKVEQSGGSWGSFGWDLLPSYFRLKSGNREVFRCDEDGVTITGNIEAESGQIGGFAITEDSLTYNDQTWGGYNYQGIYLGPEGLQLGSYDGGFRVDSRGYLYAESGEFRGTVHAGSITSGYGDTLNGGAITEHSISGGEYGQIAGSTITGGWDGNIASGTITGGYYGNLKGGTVESGNIEEDTAEAIGHGNDAYQMLNGAIQVTNRVSFAEISVTSLQVGSRHCFWGKVGGKWVLCGSDPGA